MASLGYHVEAQWAVVDAPLERIYRHCPKRCGHRTAANVWHADNVAQEAKDLPSRLLRAVYNEGTGVAGIAKEADAKVAICWVSREDRRGAMPRHGRQAITCIDVSFDSVASNALLFIVSPDIKPLTASFTCVTLFIIWLVILLVLFICGGVIFASWNADLILSTNLGVLNEIFKLSSYTDLSFFLGM